MTDKEQLKVTQAGESAADRPVVAKRPIAVQFDELIENQIDVVAGLRSIGMTGDQHGLPCRKVAVNLLFEVEQLAANAANMLGVLGRGIRFGFETSKQLLHLVDLSFKRQRRRGHYLRLRRWPGIGFSSGYPTKIANGRKIADQTWRIRG